MGKYFPHKGNLMFRLNKFYISVLCFLIFSGLGIYWNYLGQEINANKQRFFMSEIANAHASSIERRLSRSLSSTFILAQGVIEHKGPINHFEQYAQTILNSVGGISNLQLAPDGIIRYIHPLLGNEKAMGHNILKDDQRKREALLAIKERRLTIAGPFELVQGGIAVIGRYPIFLPEKNDDKFWGFASALIFLDEIISITEMNHLEAKGYSYQLHRIHPDTGVDQIFSKSNSALTNDTFTVPIKVPGTTWDLTMSFSKSPSLWRFIIGYTVSILGGLIAAWLAYFFLKQPERLRKIVVEKTKELEHRANYDALTGLANRYYLSDQLDDLFTHNPKNIKPAALMYMDLDDFKRVNDSVGHKSGDLLLQQISARLLKLIGDDGIVTRLGGDEFGILLINYDSPIALQSIAEQIIETIEQPVILDNKSFIVSTSIGITLIPENGHNDFTILQNADLAMYAAKKDNNIKYCFYHDALQTQYRTRLALEEDICAAINNDQFILHYQPIISLVTGQLDSYEVLIRWEHPKKGLLYPDKFISAAEHTGKIVDIGYWVIEQVCKQIKSVQSNLGVDVRFALNLSPRQFNDPQLFNKINAIVLTTGIHANMLEIEVTESCIMENTATAIDMLNKLKSLGITIALDDFGTGYSSLSLLKDLPVDRLKIDRSFINDLQEDKDNQNIVEALIWMAHKLNLDVIAEGIETKSQLAFLKHHQCGLGQGYLFSKPLAFDSLQLDYKQHF
jgi:diguanylate cyclase (GGDEF)-like protein